MLKKIYNSKWFPRILCKRTDGGKDSGVTAYFLIEWKILFSIALLRFNKGSREAFHTHAFNALTWWLDGIVTESRVIYIDYIYLDNKKTLFYKTKKTKYKESLLPKFTSRSNMHKVIARRTTWALTIRGPWKNTWKELKNNQIVTLTHGRKIVNTNQ